MEEIKEVGRQYLDGLIAWEEYQYKLVDQLCQIRDDKLMSKIATCLTHLDGVHESEKDKVLTIRERAALRRQTIKSGSTVGSDE